MKKNFIAIIKNILKNKNILNIVLKLLKKMEVLVFFRQITLM